MSKRVKYFSLCYQTLLKEYSFRNWWPAKTPFEVIIGAILTQNCAWSNVEKAISNIKKEKALNAKVLLDMESEKLEALIRPTGYYRQKTLKVKAFLEYFKKYNFSIKKMAKEEDLVLREELLGVWGIGKETADSILCYALDKPIFVIDAYTRRIFSRAGRIDGKDEYDNIACIITKDIEKSVEVYNDFHAQIVYHAVEKCKTKPLCETCCLLRQNLCKGL